MLNKILKIIFVIFCVLMLAYIALPNFSFPTPPPGSLKSQEPADLESPLRQGYFTNYTRAQVIAWYKNQFDHSNFVGIKIPTFLLNYPPEDAQTLIRDQTSSTFLQELVHPFRESMYINGFKPPSFNDEPIFLVGGKHWSQKVIVRLVPSPLWMRLGFFVLTIFLTCILYTAWHKSLTNKKT